MTSTLAYARDFGAMDLEEEHFFITALHKLIHLSGYVYQSKGFSDNKQFLPVPWLATFLKKVMRPKAVRESRYTLLEVRLSHSNLMKVCQGCRGGIQKDNGGERRRPNDSR